MDWSFQDFLPRNDLLARSLIRKGHAFFLAVFEEYINVIITELTPKCSSMCYFNSTQPVQPSLAVSRKNVKILAEKIHLVFRSHNI